MGVDGGSAARALRLRLGLRWLILAASYGCAFERFFDGTCCSSLRLHRLKAQPGLQFEG